MKQVTFTRDMRPYHAGGKLLVADEIAARLAENGIVDNVIDWPAKPTAQSEANPVPRGRRAMRPRDRDLLSQTYLTK